MSAAVLTFVIVGLDDHPIFEADLMLRGEAACSLLPSLRTSVIWMPESNHCPGEAGSRDDRTQYLHQFVLHAALDAVEDQQWQSTNMNLGVVDKFNNLQVGCTASVTVPWCS